MIPPSGAQIIEYCARPTASVRGSRDEGRGERVAGIVALDEQLAHVRQVEQAGALADGAVLLEDARVLDRHQPATELDEPGAEGAVDVDERRLVELVAGAVGGSSAAVMRDCRARACSRLRSRRGAPRRVGHELALGREAQQRRRPPRTGPSARARTRRRGGTGRRRSAP